MTKKDREREDDLRRRLRLQSIGIDFAASFELERLSRRYRRSLENECSSDDWRQDQSPKDGLTYYDRQQARIEKRARALMPSGVELYVQTDCRGCSLYVIPPSARRPIDSYYDADGIALA